MTSSPKRIIRGAEVKGVMFCTPNGKLDPDDPVMKQEKENLQALEEFWHRKGFDEGKAKGFADGVAEGKEDGYRKGLSEGEEKGQSAGYEEGYQTGLTEGREESQSELENLLDAVNTISEDLTQERENMIENSRPEMVKLVVSIAEVMIRRELKDPATFTKLVTSLLVSAQAIAKEARLDVGLSPEDHKEIQELIGEQDSTKIHFLADKSVIRGDCRIESHLGLVNFNVKRLLEDLERHLLEVDDVRPSAESERSDPAGEELQREEAQPVELPGLTPSQEEAAEKA